MAHGVSKDWTETLPDRTFPRKEIGIHHILGGEKMFTINLMKNLWDWGCSPFIHLKVLLRYVVAEVDPHKASYLEGVLVAALSTRA